MILIDLFARKVFKFFTFYSHRSLSLPSKCVEISSGRDRACLFSFIFFIFCSFFLASQKLNFPFQVFECQLLSTEFFFDLEERVFNSFRSSLAYFANLCRP